jgi:eukaryotic-like serine/threonine-protein kinase
VLVGVDGVARVLDFGVAKASERIQTTHQGELKGKLSYMAPEQITSKPLDRRTDVYAAAVVMWEALTGTKLFHGGSEGAILSQILLDPQRLPTHLNHAVRSAYRGGVWRIWSATSGSGSPTTTAPTRPTTRSIPRGPPRGRRAYCAAAGGTARTPTGCGPRSVSRRPPTHEATAWAFAAR